ncbi:unnamed protein product [Lymnaea stagnalis]|uniref:Uncharacterized protein n=1 Tax=Lymnaea stagnalis TaxID=6523 RepID=A0AAV2HGF0_LYMST
MPTEIKVVIPLTYDDDVDDNFNENDNVIKSVKEENVRKYPESSASAVNVKDVSYVTATDVSNMKETSHSRTHRFRTRQSSTKRNASTEHNTSADTKVLLTSQHRIPLDLDQDDKVLLDMGQGRGSAQNPTRPKTCHGQREGQRTGQCVHLSISGTYDIDVEHRDIMVKALRAYSRHRFNDSGGSYTNNNRDPAREQNCDSQVGKRTEGVKGQLDQDVTQIPGAPGADANGSNRDFRLSQCRLKFHDDIDFMTSMPRGRGPSLSVKRKPLMTSSPAVVTAVPTLYALEESDGIIADAVGHVYQHKRVRPWTALPGKYVEYVRVNTSDTPENLNIRASDTGRTSSSSHAVVPPTRRRSTSSTAPGRHPSTAPSHHPSTVPSHPPSTAPSPQPRNAPSPQHRVGTRSMSDNVPHSMAFQRRNRTTHIWTDGSQLMSTSLPTGSFLHQHVNSSLLSSPRSSRSTASEKTSPAGKPSRPSSSYSYDGGFFLGAHSGHAEYFVIHPDWVSEAVSIKKLSIGSKPSTPPVSKSASFRGGNWCGRRCLSAPPAKRRNPITWDVSDPIDIPAKP